MKIKILFLVFIVALVSCKKDDNNDPLGPSFLKNGNKWVYDMSVSSQNVSNSGDFTYEVLNKIDTENYTIEEITHFDGFQAEVETTTWAFDNVFNLGRDMRNVGVGDSWSEPHNGVDYFTSVIEDGVEVTVPAGTFTCRKLRQTQSDNTTLEGFHYYNEDFGVVLVEQTYQQVEQGQTFNVESKMKLKSTNF